MTDEQSYARLLLELGQTLTRPPSLSRRDLLKGLLASISSIPLGSAAFAQTPLPPGKELEQIVLTIIGLLQPASQEDIRRLLLGSITDNEGSLYASIVQAIHMDLPMIVSELEKSAFILKVLDEPQARYALTARGNVGLGLTLAKTRDVVRMFLLRGPKPRRSESSRGSTTAGGRSDSPSDEFRIRLERTRQDLAVRTERPWSSLAAVFETGSPVVFPRDTVLSYLSFDSLSQLAAAGGTDIDGRITIDGLALCLGVSRGLLEYLADRRERQYRRFAIPKRSGGTRTIESPRIFLKLVQRFILDFVLIAVRSHDSVHSFETGFSPISNSRPHIGRGFVATMDIVDYFGSIAETQVLPLLPRRLLDSGATELITRLCTKGESGNGHLPQGAPTSPKLSNLFLASFDAEFSKFCEAIGVTYTRYADDLSLSGEADGAVHHAVHVGRQWLLARGLQVNGDKLRFEGRNNQQRVTGLVVNVKGWPPRKTRRRIRAMFHRSSFLSAADKSRLAELKGHIANLESLEQLEAAEQRYPTKELDVYRGVVKKLQSQTATDRPPSPSNDP